MADDAFVDGDELVVAFETFPVALGDAPARLGVLLQRFEACFLFFFGKVQPEFDDECTFVGQHLLHALGALQALVEFSRLGVTHRAVQDRPCVPGAHEHADLALGGQGAPEAPHHGAFHLFVGWLAHAVGLDEARVHPLVEQVHRLAASRAVHAADEDDDGKFRFLRQIELRIQQCFT